MGNADMKNMELPTTVYVGSGEALHPQEVDAEKPIRIGLATDGLHKIKWFEKLYGALTNADISVLSSKSKRELVKKNIHVEQIATRSPVEPNHLRAVTLVRDKAISIFRRFQSQDMYYAKWNRFPKVDEIAVSDVNVRRSQSGEDFIPMRKLTGDVTDEVAIDRIVTLFREYGEESAVDIQTEAGMGFYKEARPNTNPDFIIVERADLHLNPPVVNALKDEKFVRAFIEFSHERQEQLESTGMNSGVKVLESPAGFKQDLFVLFLREIRFNTQTYHIDPDRDMQIHVHREGRSDLDALIAITAGCGIRQMKEIARWVARGMQRMQSEVVIESEDPIAGIGK